MGFVRRSYLKRVGQEFIRVMSSYTHRGMTILGHSKKVAIWKPKRKVSEEANLLVPNLRLPSYKTEKSLSVL
jgi:hypothetical protein